MLNPVGEGANEMASNSPVGAIGRAEAFTGSEARTEQANPIDKQAGHALSESVTSRIGDSSPNARWAEMTAPGNFSCPQAQLILNDGFTLADDQPSLAKNPTDAGYNKQINVSDGNGERGTEKSKTENPEDAKLHHTIDAIRRSGMLEAPGRTGPDDIEYKMVIFKDGSSTHAYKQKFLMHDGKTGSDVFTADPELIKQIFLNHLKGNGPAELIHSHPNKPGMDPNLFSKEDIAESNAANVDSIIVTPDGRVFKHKANPDARYMDPANIPDSMRVPDECLGKFDKDGKFHKAKNDGKNVTFEKDGF